ncbi:hypothetical protein [Novosphingobium terrae]|uniref:hypothetical protein n=1 Tax=Novosphingobium terrae TaxID=2726189 RepID=UPI00198197BC|nr:hypothetical protein [Novosphingobium terrae]
MDKRHTRGLLAAAKDEFWPKVRPLDLDEGWTDDGDGPAAGSIAVVDISTVGSHPAEGRIIRLTLRSFEYDSSGAITWIGDLLDTVEDPGTPTPTGMHAAAENSVSEPRRGIVEDWTATEVLRAVSIVVAHGVDAVRPWVESRFEHARGLRWACSMSDVDWPARGFHGFALNSLLWQSGYSHGRNVPGAGTDAVVQLLRHRSKDNRTALAELLDRQRRPS